MKPLQELAFSKFSEDGNAGQNALTIKISIVSDLSPFAFLTFIKFAMGFQTINRPGSRARLTKNYKWIDGLGVIPKNAAFFWIAMFIKKVKWSNKN